MGRPEASFPSVESSSGQGAWQGLESHRDVISGLLAVHVWAALGWHDIQQRYRRSVLGPFWLTLSTAIMVVVLGMLYSRLLGQDISTYLPFLAVGLVVWNFIATMANEACTVFTGAEYLIKQIKMPLSIHVARLVWRNLIILAHSLPVAMIAILGFGHSPTWSWILVLPGMVLIALNGLWVTIVLGIFCTRFRDIPPVIQNLIQVAFFFTPVMWMPEILKERAWIVTSNPFYHLIELVRAPLLGRPLGLEAWLAAIAMVVIGFLVAQIFVVRYRARVPYWL